MGQFMNIFPIPWEEALEGCRLSIENAERLAEDSIILQRNGRLQSAYCISLDAWEELGKAVLLYRYYKTKQPITEGDWYQILRDHKRKRIAMGNSMDLFEDGPQKSVNELKDSLATVLKEKRDRKWFALERGVGVHVDWVGGEKPWESPCKVDEAWFRTVPLDSDYWARSTQSICKTLKRNIDDYMNTVSAC